MTSSTVNTEFVLPQVVRLELPAHLRRELASADIKTARRLIPNLPNDSELLEQHAKLINQNFTVVPAGEIDASHARGAVERAVSRRSPCTDGEQIRDALIWEAVLAIAAAEPDRSVYFFVTDKRFWIKNAGPIPELLAECDALDVKVRLFRNARDFITRNNEAVSFVTDNWISKYLGERLASETEPLIEGLVRNYLEPYPEPLRLKYGGELEIVAGQMSVSGKWSMTLPDNSVALSITTSYGAQLCWELEEPVAALPEGAAGLSLIQDSGRTFAKGSATLLFRSDTVVEETKGNLGSVLTDGYVELNLGSPI